MIQSIQEKSSLTTGRSSLMRFPHQTYTGHTDGVDSVVWSPDGKEIASGSYDQIAQVWDALTGTKRLTYRGQAGTG